MALWVTGAVAVLAAALFSYLFRVIGVWEIRKRLGELEDFASSLDSRTTRLAKQRAADISTDSRPGKLEKVAQLMLAAQGNRQSAPQAPVHPGS